MTRDRFELLERFTPLFEAPDSSFERFLHLRDRKRRSQRIAAAIAGTAIVVVFVSVLAVVVSSRDVPTDLATAPGAPSAGSGLIAFVGTSGESEAEPDTEIYVVAPDGTGLRALTTTPGVSETAPVWSPDGTRLAFLRNGTGGSELVVIDPSTGDKTFSADIPNPPNSGIAPPQWSPNGRLIVLTLSNSDRWLIVDLETGTWTTMSEGNGAFLGWSPDGMWFLWHLSSPSVRDQEQLFLIPADLLGTSDLDDITKLPGVRLLVQLGCCASRVTWMPDSSAVAISLPDNSTDVVTIADGRRRTLIEDGVAPSWSPDGSHLAYLRCLEVPAPADTVPADLAGVAPNQPGASVWVAAADGTGARAVATSLRPPIWSPGGSLLVVGGDDGLFTVRPDGASMTRLTRVTAPKDASGGTACLGQPVSGAGYSGPVWQPVPLSAAVAAEAANTGATETMPAPETTEIPAPVTTEVIATDAAETSASVTTEASGTTQTPAD
jgi:dipeptidyl aminopeptidase/acylaminoacyl peptidase